MGQELKLIMDHTGYMKVLPSNYGMDYRRPAPIEIKCIPYDDVSQIIDHFHYTYFTTLNISRPTGMAYVYIHLLTTSELLQDKPLITFMVNNIIRHFHDAPYTGAELLLEVIVKETSSLFKTPRFLEDILDPPQYKLKTYKSKPNIINIDLNDYTRKVDL